MKAEATYFRTPAELGRWFRRHHATAKELLVGFHKVGSGTPSITWPQSVDEALCVGWIDGVRKRVDDERYTIRFTPRRKGSTWSLVNIRRVEALTREGRMLEAGLAAFALRSEKKDDRYSYEKAPTELLPAFERRIRKDKAAWKFLQARAPWYRKRVIHWVMGAKQEATRLRRLEKLVEACAEGRLI